MSIELIQEYWRYHHWANRRLFEVATTLGPVVGTHAGPGTVGLFWLQD